MPEGRYVLRIEDTDRLRSTQENVDAILDGLSWLGLDVDEGPFYQTKRYDRYRAVTGELLSAGKAYYCCLFCENPVSIRPTVRPRQPLPPIDVTLFLIGRERVLRCIDYAIGRIRERRAAS